MSRHRDDNGVGEYPKTSVIGLWVVGGKDGTERPLKGPPSRHADYLVDPWRRPTYRGGFVRGRREWG